MHSQIIDLSTVIGESLFERKIDASYSEAALFIHKYETDIY